MWTTQKARYLSIATKRAQAEMERVQDLGVLTLLNGPTEESYPSSTYTYHGDSRGVDFTEENLPEGAGSVTWTPHPPGGAAGSEYMLKVDVILTWQGAARSRTQVEVTTLLTNRK